MAKQNIKCVFKKLPGLLWGATCRHTEVADGGAMVGVMSLLLPEGG